MSWFSATFRQGFANLGGPALKRFDARALARRWKETGAELVYMDGIHQTETLFPTAISTMAPHLDGRDLVAEFTTACKELGLRSGAYITPFEHTPFSRNHPEFSQTDTAGKLVPGPNWAEGAPYWSCWNTPFLDRMCALIMEMFGKYDLDAAFFDGLLSRHGICRCPSCVVKFKADTGNELPAAVDLTNPVFREYLRWKDRTLVDACKRLRGAAPVRRRLPDRTPGRGHPLVRRAGRRPGGHPQVGSCRRRCSRRSTSGSTCCQPAASWSPRCGLAGCR